MTDKLSDFEELQIQLIKDGIEDLNLYVLEIENINKKLSDENLDLQEKTMLIYKLIDIENKILNMSESVKDNFKIEIDKDMIS